jgi:uncharacterized protein
MRYIIFLSFIFIFLVTGCEKHKASSEYINSVHQWHKNRIARLKSQTGWLNLVGLYWLKEGENNFGSAQDNDIVFPSNTPEHIGVFVLNSNTVTAVINPGVKVYTDSTLVSNVKLKDDLSGSPTVLRYGSSRWVIINRNGKFGVRLRDLNAPLVKNFKGIETYPVNEKWRVEAKFEPYSSPKVIAIPNIIGSIEKDTVEGKLSFTLEGKKYTLTPVSEGNEFFIIFADETNGNETYGAGRFLYADKPDSTGKTILDFNKAYNPPCAFTSYATCPLPPKQNYLHLKITAGEKKYGNH